MLVGTNTEWVEVPHEPGNRFQMAALNWQELKEARKDRQTEAIASMRAMGGDIMQALPKSADNGTTAPADPLDTYSMATLIRYGLRDWQGPGYSDARFSAENVGRLDDTTAEWAARTIYGMSRIEGTAKGKSLARSAATTEQMVAAFADATQEN